ncbi:hypothetical protein EB796_011386 [Bugula neritina]|uniref:Secreted protein n=1 Tax=Bugula neritina TaxID=10212 RepID=A0A7J7JY86_BUGNE|nr:hypothetical protein EB796_011386 [Bugula neritina]
MQLFHEYLFLMLATLNEYVTSVSVRHHLLVHIWFKFLANVRSWPSLSKYTRSDAPNTKFTHQPYSATYYFLVCAVGRNTGISMSFHEYVTSVSAGHHLLVHLWFKLLANVRSWPSLREYTRSDAPNTMMLATSP